MEGSDREDLWRELSVWCNTSHNLQLPRTIPPPSVIVWESLDRSEHSMVQAGRSGNV